MFKKKKEMETEQEKTVKAKLYTEDEILEMILEAHQNLSNEAVDKESDKVGMLFMLSGIAVAAEVRKIMDEKKGIKHDDTYKERDL